jgi:hypothetical protein
MRTAAAFVIGSVVVLRVLAGTAQEGHPLTGTWSGDWGPSAAQRTHVTMVMTWDGKTISGTINPGPDAITVETIGLDVANWTIRFDAETKGPSGPSRISAEGRLENIASANRSIVGTWRQGNVTGDFRLTRD